MAKYTWTRYNTHDARFAKVGEVHAMVLVPAWMPSGVGADFAERGEYEITSEIAVILQQRLPDGSLILVDSSGAPTTLTKYELDSGEYFVEILTEVTE